MRDPHSLLVGGQADEGKTDEELEREQEAEEHERQAFIDDWKAMYRLTPIPTTLTGTPWQRPSAQA
ncbi:MAG: hypothetical protein ABI068_06440 [Ktedonobacterales bacterium]